MIAIVGGAHVTTVLRWQSNVDVRSAARQIPATTMRRMNTGKTIPPYLSSGRRSEISMNVRSMAACLQVEPLYTFEFALDDIAEAVDVLVETQDRRFVVLKP